MTNLLKSAALAFCISTKTEVQGRRLANPNLFGSRATHNSHNSIRDVQTNEKYTTLLDSSLFLYRGGEVHDDDNSHDMETNNSNGSTTSPVDANEEAVKEHPHSTTEEQASIHVQTTVSSSSPPEDVKFIAKKSNAVGDPDGNSSDDEDSDEEDLLFDELAEIERRAELERSSNNVNIDDNEFDKLISLAERREGMKRRLEEMEAEMKRRRGDDVEITLELVDDEDDDDEQPSIDSSYHLAKEKITQDTVMKRQRKYKRGFMTNKKRNETEVVKKVETTIDSQTLDGILIEAFRPMLFLPPPSPRLPSVDGSVSLKNVDIASRRRLDRRTLYHGLLAELGGSHSEDKSSQSIRRRYLEGETARELRGALSLACQPKWRERIMVGPSVANVRKENVTELEDDEEDDYDETDLPADWYRGGVCLFPSLDDEEEASKKSEFTPPKPQQFGPQPMGMEGQGSFFGEFNNNEEGYAPQSPPPKPWRCTMSMQETLAMALAHSLSCGLALIDDEALSLVRERVEQSLAELAGEENADPVPTIDPEELRNAALIGHLVRLANDGEISLCHEGSADEKKTRFGMVSDRMERDMKLDLDDSNDDLAVESLRLMKEDEKYWFESNDAEKGKHNKRPLPLILFLRSDSAPAILRSKSAVETLAHECVKKDGIHLLVLGGKGIDATTTTLPEESPVGVANNRMHKQHAGRGKAFSMMSNFPPGSPEFNAQMENSQRAGHFTPGAFNTNNINASGVNDPEGSRRFNIFLARTVDQTGKPQIMGTIAPPQAGNLFPTILANMAKENLRKIKEEGVDESNEQQAFFMKQMEELVNQVQQMGEDDNGSDPVNAAFFNATITSPFGSEVMNQNSEAENGTPSPPPEFVKRAIQDAMTGVIDRLAQMSASNNNGGSGIPMNIARAFSQVLSNENLRRGIAENLSRAAPALIDPRCQGVMLSVYVPPGPDHPNKGMMPGDQFKGQKQPRPSSQGPTDKHNTSPHGVGGWLNKILSSSTDKGKEEEADQSSSTSQEQKDGTATGTTASSAEEAAEDESSTPETIDLDKQSAARQSKQKGSKRKRSMDRARTLAVAAAALAGSKKEQKQKGKQTPTKLTPQQRGHRNLVRLQALCRNVPLPNPSDPVRARSWEAWADREEGSVVFRKNRSALIAHLTQRKLSIEVHGSRGAGTVLRQMLSVRDVTSDMDSIIKCAVELEAAKSQRHDESPWGVPKSSADGETKRAVDKTLVAFLQKQNIASDADTSGIRFIHPASLELALSNICGVSPSSGISGASSSSSAMASHRSKEDLMALAQDKHERALIPNCVSPQDIGVTYDMIGGLNEVKELLRQSITYPLKFPHLYNEGIAREAVKGVLLFGPPGTGKTMLAKAVATEGGASFLSVDASSVENKWLGESEKNAKAVFTLARRLAPCVIFIDEVDSLLSSREGSSDDSAHGTLTSVKTTMMSEWDGLNSGTNGKGEAGSDRVVVIGSTNRPFDLDEAVLRRFPRRILVDLPDLETRREILEVTLSENRLGPDVNLTRIAERLEGYTGSDLKEVCREAVVQISHEQARMLDRGELLDEEDEDQDSAGSSQNGFQMLRPVTMSDFESAMRKLKRSVSETGRELARVWEWNDQYGELKKTNKRDSLPQMMNMFV